MQSTLKEPWRPSNLAETLQSLDASSEFSDPYSDLSLFLSQKVKEEVQEEGVFKKWSSFLQEKLVQKISPEFEKKFPNCRLGVHAIRKTFEKIAYYHQQMGQQKEAMTKDGKLNLSYLIKENLRQYFQHRSPSNLHPYHFAHQLAMKLSDCMATMEGTRPMLDHLARTIWAVQRHMLPAASVENAKSPYDEFDKLDRLIVKMMLEVSGKHPQISQKELEERVKEAVLELQELPNITSFDRVTANVSSLLAEKLYPISNFHTLYFSEQKQAIFNFIRRHLKLCKTAFPLPLRAEWVRRTIALYTLASSLPKDASEHEPLPQSIKAFLAAEEQMGASIPNVTENLRFGPSQNPEAGQSQLARISNTGDVEIAPAPGAFASARNQVFSDVRCKLEWAIYEEAKLLPSLSQEHLEMIIWKVMNEEDGFLKELPYRVGMKLEEEIAQILIDHPQMRFATIVDRVVQFFKRSKELTSSKKWAEIEKKISLWTMQGDLVCRWLKIDPENTLLKQIVELMKAKTCNTHAQLISEATQIYLRNHPNLAPYTPHVMARISILYKYAWYALFASSEESSFDRFLAWHRLEFNDKTDISVLEEICKKTLPLIPFDSSLLMEEKKESEKQERHA